ncbi:MAG TPA: hypothetical protein VGC31_10690, partial [Paenirhodobacter sp.]
DSGVAKVVSIAPVEEILPEVAEPPEEGLAEAIEPVAEAISEESTIVVADVDAGPSVDINTAEDIVAEQEETTELTAETPEPFVGMPRFAIHRGGANADLRAAFEDADEEGEPADTAPMAASNDEDALRLLVARLIREELQGVLGQKITQNVRKLVRREIQRSLIGTDFE